MHTVSPKSKLERTKLILYLIWQDWLVWNMPHHSGHTIFVLSAAKKLKCSSTIFGNTHEVKNFAAAPTPLQFSTSIIRHGMCTDLILESNNCFTSIYQSNIFNLSTVIKGFFLINSSMLLLRYSDRWVYFFSERASIGDFIFLYLYTSTSGGVKCSYTELSCTGT